MKGRDEAKVRRDGTGPVLFQSGGCVGRAQLQGKKSSGLLVYFR